MKRLKGIRKPGERSIRSGDQSSSKDGESVTQSQIRKNSVDRKASLTKKEKPKLSTFGLGSQLTLNVDETKEDARRGSTYSFANTAAGSP